MGAQGVCVYVGVCAHYDKKPVSQLQIFLSKSGKNIFWSILKIILRNSEKGICFATMFNTNQKNMFLIQFNNGKFLGLTMSQELVYAHNINFAYTFESIEKAIDAFKFVENQLGEVDYTITDLSGNPLVSIF
jgi:hypothetical protein